MPLKNILLHLANDESHERRLQIAIDLAHKYDGHIHACYFTQPESMPAAVTGRGASYTYLQEATAIAHEKAEVIRTEIANKCGSLSWSFEILEEDHVDAMARRSFLADLAIVGQSNHATRKDRVSLHLPDRLTLVATCPTLVVPHQPAVTFAGKHLSIAWKHKREASRALRDSLGLLADAEQVSIILLAKEKNRVNAEAEGEQVKRFLDNHGIAAEIRMAEAHSTRGNGTPLINCAKEIGSDGIVMGAYSHSRLREQILGGMTYYMLNNSDVPLIMSH